MSNAITILEHRFASAEINSEEFDAMSDQISKSPKYSTKVTSLDSVRAPSAELNGLATVSAVQSESEGEGEYGKGVVYAGFWFRSIALLFDTVISQVGALIVALPMGFLLGASMAASGSGQQEIAAVAEGMGMILGLVCQWLYFTMFESSSWQATPGKRALDLKVVSIRGEKISFGKANGRYWSKIISWLIVMIGFFMAAFTDKKQALHDIIASTLVIKSN